ncbi:MAG: winged helix-turn-helix transcriptional regulator [Candidatus Thorarchaeota archaeon]|jgi:DNA-binding Lrp family transcriptional regulator
MDFVDRTIIERLELNCRTSLQELARSTNISANEVKKRIDSLEKSGIIENFKVILSPLITEEESVIAILEFETEQNEKKLLTILSNNQSISMVSRLLDERYIVHGIYFNQDELASLTSHLRTLPGIRNIEMYSRFLNYWGGIIDFTSSHRDILRCLLEDPRMLVSEITRETGLSSNHIKTIIDQMRESEAVLFTIDTSDDANEGSIEVMAKVHWNVGKTSKEDVLGWLQEEFAKSYLGECVSATEPTLFFNFLVKHVQEVEILIQKAKKSGLVSSIEPLILLPGTKFPDPRLRKLNELLLETGFVT